MFKSNTHGLNGLKQKLVKTITFASIGALLFVSLVVMRQGHVQGAPSTTLNFQARLLNSNGTLVQDGYYHIQFRMYAASTGGSALWNESYTGATNGQRVRVVNGYFSVYLGTNDSLADESDINWNEELYLTMQIGGSATSASWDSEMDPRIKLTAVPYAFQANQLAHTSGANRGTLSFDTLTDDRDILLPDEDGTICLQNSSSCGFLTGDADDFIRNQTTQQTGANFNILASGGVAATIQGASGQNILVLNDNGGSPVLTVEADGDAVLAADLSVNGGDIRSTAGLNVTALNGAVVVTSTGSTNDITLASADQVILNANTGSTIELQDSTNITGNLNVDSNTLFVNATSDRVGIGNATPGAALEVTGDIYLTREGNRNIKLADSTTASTAGSTLSILGANGNSATGGAISIIAGIGNQTNSLGGAVTVQGGEGLNGLSTGGAVNITGGNGLSGGAININGGAGFFVGNIVMQATDPNGSVGIGTASPDARLELAGNKTQTAWGLNGIQLQASSATYTDASTAASGTATNAAFNSFATPTLAASNTGVTTTNAATVYIQGAPTAGTNQTITNAYSLWVGAGTVRFDSTITNTGTGQDVNMTLGNDGDVDTVSAINIDVTSAATGDADVVYGLNVGNLTSANGTVLERAIRIGSGWDEALDVNGTLISLAELQALDAGIAAGELTTQGTATDEFCLTYEGGGGALLEWQSCTSSLTLQTVYDNDADGSDAVIALTAADGAVVIRDAASTVGNLFVVEANGGTDYLTVTNTGITVGGSGTFSGDVAANGGDVTSTTSLNVTASNGALTLTSTGGSNNINLISAGTIELQDNTNVTGALDVSGRAAIGDNASTSNALGLVVNEEFVNGDGCSSIGCWAGLFIGRANNTTGNTGGIFAQASATGGTITDVTGLFISNSTEAGGTITNGVGIRVQSQTSGDNNVGILIDGATGTNNTNLLIGQTGIPTGDYSIYNASSLQNYFNGNIFIGGDASGTADILLNTDGSAVFNEQGSAVNFRIESDTNTNLFNTSGTNNSIGIGTAATSELVTIDSSNDGRYEIFFDGIENSQIVSESNLYLGYDSDGTSGSSEFAIYTNTTTEVFGINDGGGIRGRGSFTSGTSLLQGAFVIQDGDGETLSITIDDVAANATVRIPDAVADGDTFCFEDLGNCTGAGITLQGVYDNDADGSDAVIALTAADGAVVIRDAASTVGNLFVVEANGGTDYLTVTNSGITVGGSGTFSGDVAANGGDVTSTTSLNLTASNGALGITSTGSGNDITLTSADQIILNPATTVDVNANMAVGTFGFAIPSQTTALIVGGNFTSSQACTGTSGAVGCIGVHGTAVGTSAGGTNPTLTGVYGANATSSGTVTNSYAFYAASATGSITNNTGLYVAAMTGGTSTNAGIIVGEALSAGNDVNLLLGTTTVPSADYSIYNASSDANYFAGNLGILDTSPSAALTVGNGDLFQVNSSGVIAAAAGITSSGTITFSGLNCTTFANGGTLTTNSSGVLSCQDDNDTASAIDLDTVYDTDADKELLIDNATGLIFDMTTTGNFQIQDSNATIANFTNAGAITFTPTSGQSFSTTVAGAGTITNTISGTGNFIANLSGTGDFVVQDNGSTFVSFDDAGGIAFTPGGTADMAVTLDSDSTFTMAGGEINLNTSGIGNTNIGGGTSSGTITIGNNSGDTPIFIHSGTSSINIGTNTETKSVLIANGGGNQTVQIGSTAGTSQTTIQGGTNNISLIASGSSNTGVVVQTSTGSTNALMIQKASASDTLFRADTSNNYVYIGDADTDPTILIVDRIATANLPANGNSGLNGGIMYDSTTSKFIIYEGGQKKEICNMTDLGCGAGATVSLQSAYDNDTNGSDVNVTTNDTDGSIFWNLHDGTTDGNFAVNIATGSTGEFKVQSNSTDVLQIGAAGQLQLDTQGTGGGILIGTDVQLYRSAANTLSTASGDALTVQGMLTGTAGASISGGTIDLNTSGTNDVNIGNDNASVDVAISGGTINIGAGALAHTVNVATGNNSTVQTLTMGSNNGASSTLIRSGTADITLSSSDSVLIDPTANSANTFVIQDSAGSPQVLFRADTTTNRLYVGDASDSVTNTTLLVVDSAATTNIPDDAEGVEDGAMIYDSTLGKFKVREGGDWKILCNTTDAGCGASGATQDLQEAYDNSTTPAIIETSDAAKNIIIRSGTGEDSTGMFQLQNSADEALFSANTADNIIKIGDDAGTALADYTLFVLDNIDDADELTTGVNGAMVYDADPSNGGRFMVYDNGWKELCNKTDLGCGSAGVAQDLQDAYNNSPSPALITTTSSTKDIIFKSGPTFNSTGMFQLQNSSGDELFVADTTNFRVSIGSNALPANGVLTVGTNTTAATGGLYFGTDTNLYRSAAGTLRTDGNFELGEGANRTLGMQDRTTNAAGNNLTISAGDAGAGGSAFGGGDLILQGGNAAGTGNAAGGDVILTSGTGVGTGAGGLVVINTPAFVTIDTDASCQPSGGLATADCTIEDSSVSSASQIIVGFNGDGFTATLPDPVNTTAGRILYVTGANGSDDFTLEVNGGGQGNEIAMKANTSATMIWDGDNWNAAGASSSTTLQAAYNNTLTSAGGAEIVLNNTASSNGLTIRNNSTSPITGGLLEVQSSVGTNLFSVNNRGTELAANGGSETEDTWTTNWTTNGGSSVARTTDSNEYVTGVAGAEVTTVSASSGIVNNLSGNPANVVGARYQVSFTAKSSEADLPVEVIYTRDGTNMNNCTDYVDGTDTSQTISDTVWTKVTCTITISSTTAPSNPDLIIRKTTTGTTPTIWIDNLSFMRNDDTTQPSNVQIGGGLDGGPITVFTLDRASAPPVEAGDQTYLGSMYYDTITGRIQCYEADGWGACGSAPDNFVNLVPEFAGAVLNGSGVGTMTADFCSNSSELTVNTSLCGSGQALNYYRWTSPQANEQTYSIYVTYKLPAAFKNFLSNSTVTLTARTDSTTNGSVSYEMFRSEGGELIRCADPGSDETLVTTSANQWQTVPINGNEASNDVGDPAACGFTSSSADQNIVFKINVRAKSNANVYVSTLSFTTTGQ